MEAWAIGAEPKPASLENTPRFTPQVMTKMTEPTAPPVTPLGENAPSKMEANTAGRVLA